MKIKQILLIFIAFLTISSQNLNDIYHLGLSYQWVNPIELDEDVDFMPNEFIGDSIFLSINFQLIDTINVDYLEFVINSNNQQELSFPFNAFTNDFNSTLYRDGNYFVTELGVFPYDTLLSVGVRMQKGDFTSGYIYESLATEE